MNTMKLLKYLLIFFIVNGSVESLRLDCEFRLNSEECKVKTLKVLESDIAVTTVSGTHAFRKSNDDVKEIWITREVETERAPTKICNFFQRLERVDIYGTSINRISREVFTNCLKVWKVCVLFTSLVTLPDELFVDLVELKELFLYENKLVALPADLILKNAKLKTLSAKSNRIGFIDTDLSTSLTSIDFRANACIDKRFPEDVTELNLFIHEVTLKCESPMKKSYLSKAIAFNATLSAREEEIVELKGKKETFESEKVALVTNVTQLMSIIDNLKMACDDLKLELDAIKTNNSQVFDKVIEENNNLRLNYSNLVTTLNEKETNFNKLSRKNQELQANLINSKENIKFLQGNLTETVLSIAEKQKVIEILEARGINLNSSLEQCWQNLSLVNEINENLSSQVDNLSVTTLSFADDITPENCSPMIHFVYFIILAVTFALILITTVVLLRRNATRNLMRHMVNQEVNMRHLIEKE